MPTAIPMGLRRRPTTSDNAITKTSYSGKETTFTDLTVMDPQVPQTMTYGGLGRLTTLADAALTTSYAYDGNSNMKQVSQGAQTRTFTYDSLNRLTSSVNPESGTVLNVGNLYQRTDNRQVLTTNTYDALNRLPRTTYTNPAGTPSTPTVTYTYDSGTNANGQLTKVATNGVSATSYTSFDVMGRFHASTQQTGGQTFTFGYAYNYAGALTGETYPSGRSLTIGYDAANRQNAVNGTMSGQNTAYINSAGYAPNGGLVSYYTNNNLLTLNQFYNMHQQVSYVAVAQGNNYQSQNYFAQTMDWGTANNNGVRLNGKNEYISNNAALPSAPTFSQTFSYDGVNRLLSASENNGANWSQAYNYDLYGNMWMPPTSHPLPTLSGAAPTTNIYNASNQNPNVNYDGAGNQTSLGSLTLSYDGENRQSQIANLGSGTGTFQYDGLGHRVVKSLPSQTTTYVYDAFGQLAAEYYSGTKPTPPCSTCFLTYDYLGNVRMVTDAQAKIIARHDFAPFGQEITSGTGGRSSDWGSTTDVDMKFTGQIRDQESTEDSFNARYLAIALGRFNSPDPGNAGASLGSSQGWNGYGYVSGNPLALVDSGGLCGGLSAGISSDPSQGGGLSLLQQAALYAYDIGYPYGGQSKLSGMGKVALGGGPGAAGIARLMIADVTAQTASTGGGSPIGAWSGGAAANQTAGLGPNNQNVAQLLLSPGGALLPAAIGPNPNLLAFSGSGVKDSIVNGTSAAPYGEETISYPGSPGCGHDATCMMLTHQNEIDQLASRKSVLSCPSSKVFLQAGSPTPASFTIPGGSGGITGAVGGAGVLFDVVVGYSCVTAGGVQTCQTNYTFVLRTQ